MSNALPPLVWLDLEMTGLDFANDSILEIALLLTDQQLNVIDEGLNLVIHTTDARLDAMDEWNTKTHTASGLIERARLSDVDEDEAQRRAIAYLQKAKVPKNHGILCGNSICTDRRFLHARMPLLDEYLHYRMIDISSIKELAKRWRPDLYEDFPQKQSKHRALDDISETLEELRHYRSRWLV